MVAGVGASNSESSFAEGAMSTSPEGASTLVLRKDKESAETLPRACQAEVQWLSALQFALGKK